ncbi:M16 family metallopeptidase [Wenyingzhuangia sp. IMCC45574]
MKRFLYAFIILVAFTACNSVTKTKKTTVSAIPTDKDVVKGTLENGLTYYIRKNPKPEQKVELRLVVKAGSILENEKQLGLAHFMEHMNFNGSKNFKKNELVDYLQSIGVKFGAHLNAYTSFDETVYILPIPTDNDQKLEKGFQILEDWAFNASLTDEEIEKERGVVLEEYRLGLGADKRMLQNWLPKLMYNSRYADRLPIGTKEVLENFTHEDLRSFYRDWYRPDLMAVVAVGDVPVEVLKEKIKSHFGKHPKVKKAKERKEYSMPNHKETLVSVNTDKEASRSSVLMYYKDKEKASPILNPEDFKKSIINQLFSIMLNNRLGELRNKENPPFIYAGSGYETTWDKSKKAYQAYALSSETGQLKALETLVTENERALRFGFLASEFTRAKKAILKSHENAFKEKNKTESSRYVSEYVRNFLSQEPIPGIEWELNNLKNTLPKITLEECNSLMHQYIHQDNLVVILTGPEKDGLKKVTEQEILNALSNVKTASIKPYQEKTFDKGLMKEIPLVIGAIVNKEVDTLLKATDITLSNGAKVTYKKTNFKNNQILFNAFSYGGSSLYSDEEYKKTVIINGVLKDAGLNGYSKDDLKKLLTGKTVRVSPRISSLSEGFSGSSTPEDLETLFQLTNLYFTKLNKDDKPINSYKAKLSGYLKNYLSKPFNYFSYEFNNFLNQNNKRYVGFPTEEILQQQDYNLAYKKYQERFSNAGDFHFYFVGNFDETKLLEYCETYLASLPSTDVKEEFKKHTVEPLTGILKKEIQKGTEPKSLVKIIYKGLVTKEADKRDGYLLKSLGELLTIKLIEQLREEEGGVYGVGAKGNISKYPHKNYNFTISFPCGPENVEKLIEKALTEVKNIQKDGVQQKDINKIIETQLLEYKEAQKKNGFWLNGIKNADFNKGKRADILNKVEKIKKLNSEELQRVANTYLTKNRITGTLKPKK